MPKIVQGIPDFRVIIDVSSPTTKYPDGFEAAFACPNSVVLSRHEPLFLVNSKGTTHLKHHQPCGVIGCSAHACWQLSPVFLNVPDVEEYLCEKHLAELRKRRPSLTMHYHALCEQAASQEVPYSSSEESSSANTSRPAFFPAQPRLVATHS